MTGHFMVTRSRRTLAALVAIVGVLVLIGASLTWLEIRGADLNAGQSSALVAGGALPTPSPTPSPSPTPTPLPTPTPSPAPPRSSTWHFVATGSMAHTWGMCSASALLPDGRVLLVGGQKQQGGDSASEKPYKTGELYDAATGKFSATGALHARRECPAAVALADGRVLVAGGDDGSNSLSSAELFDPTTGQFAPTGSMAEKRDGPTAAPLPGGKALIVGGDTDNPASSAEVYDPQTGSFAPAGAMTPHATWSMTVLKDGRILLIGCHLVGGNQVGLAEIYDSAIGTFSTADKMPRCVSSATLLADGRVLLVEGAGTNNAQAKGAWLFEPQTMQFAATGSMTSAMVGPDVIALPDGDALVVGNGNGTIGQLYDPSSGTFSPCGKMVAGRAGALATRLLDGRVLIAGGNNQLYGDLATAELFEP